MSVGYFKPPSNTYSVIHINASTDSIRHTQTTNALYTNISRFNYFLVQQIKLRREEIEEPIRKKVKKPENAIESVLRQK